MFETFHRKIALKCQPGIVDGEIRDTMHHFRVRLYHDDKNILKTESTAIRYPWSTCPQADSKLEELIGMPLDSNSSTVGRFATATEHCTHIFDLTGLMVAHAAHKRPPWEYYAQVTEAGPGQQQATLSCNGQQILDWRIKHGVIDAQAPYQDVNLQKQFIQWAEQNLNPEQVDAALIMRRTWTIAAARFVDLSVIESAAKLNIPAHCYSLQPVRSKEALPMQGMTVDYDKKPLILTAVDITGY